MFDTLSFPELLILLLVGLLFFKEQILVLISQWFGKERDYDDGDPITTMQGLGQKFGETQKAFFELKQYVNHRQSEILDNQTNLLKEISLKMDRHNDMERENHNKLEEIIKYGVNCRKD